MEYIKALKSAKWTWRIAGIMTAVYIGMVLGMDCTMLPLSASWSLNLMQPWRLITYIFVHANPLHLIFNLLLFIAAGAWVEHSRGAMKMWGVAVAGAIAGAAVFIILSSFAESPFILLGSSGSSCALTGYALIDKRHHNLYGNWIFGAILITMATGVFTGNAAGAGVHIAALIAGAAMAWRDNRPAAATHDATGPIVEKAGRNGFSSLSQAERDSLFTDSKH